MFQVMLIPCILVIACTIAMAFLDCILTSTLLQYLHTLDPMLNKAGYSIALIQHDNSLCLDG